MEDCHDLRPGLERMRMEGLERARVAHSRCRWEEAYRGFREARAEGQRFGAEDLAAFADAAW